MNNATKAYHAKMAARACNLVAAQGIPGMNVNAYAVGRDTNRALGHISDVAFAKTVRARHKDDSTPKNLRQNQLSA